jgi:Domain of unknown function (DUF4157)/D-alanyl-D-alanine carboxypeptidase
MVNLMGHQRSHQTKMAEATRHKTAAASVKPPLPTRAPLHPILQLQRLIGNRAVSQLIQAKLKVSQPGDVFEQEADRIAEAVMRMPDPRMLKKVAISQHPQQSPIQRVCSECEEELHRQPMEEEEEEKMLHAKEVPGSTPVVTPALEAHINRMQGGGQPLPETLRAFFEPRFGSNFSQVRIHTDAQAAESARAVNALAYTVGRYIVFGRGQYQPQTIAGQHLLAHELMHVVQQVERGAHHIQRQLALPPTKTNYRFDTFSITQEDLSDPEIIALLKALSREQLTEYSDQVVDPAVKEYISSLLAAPIIKLGSNVGGDPIQQEWNSLDKNVKAVFKNNLEIYRTAREQADSEWNANPIIQHYVRKEPYRWIRVRYKEAGINDVAGFFGTLEKATLGKGSVPAQPEVAKAIDQVRVATEKRLSSKLAISIGGFDISKAVEPIAQVLELVGATEKTKSHRLEVSAGGFVPREKRPGGIPQLGTLSEHAFGRAIDVDASNNEVFTSEEWQIIEGVIDRHIDRSRDRWRKTPGQLWADIDAANQDFMRLGQQLLRKAQQGDKDAQNQINKWKGQRINKAKLKNRAVTGFMNHSLELVEEFRAGGFVWGVTFANPDIHHFELPTTKEAKE